MHLFLVLVASSLSPCEAFAALVVGGGRGRGGGGRLIGLQKWQYEKIVSPVSWASMTIAHDDPDSSLLDEEGSEDVHTLHWLDPNAQDDYETRNNSADRSADTSGKVLGEVIGQGEVVVCIPDVASEAECQTLFSAGLESCKGRGGSANRGRSRMSVSDPTCFPNSIVLMCDEILLRVLDYLDENIPSIYQMLFEPSNEWLSRQPLNAYLEQPTVPPQDHLADMCDGLRELYMMGELEWSEGEPAINVYEASGYFGAHKVRSRIAVSNL